MDVMDLVLSAFLGIGLAAAVGFRVFLPLLILSLAGFYEVIPLQESWLWMGSLTAVITLAIATVIELFGYFIPWFDNILDTIAIPLAAIAGTLVIVATIGDMSPVATWALAIIAGGGTATVIKGNASALRLTSSASTGGLANPVVATVETGGATAMSLASIFIPALAMLLLLFIFFGIYKIYKKLRKKKASNL